MKHPQSSWIKQIILSREPRANYDLNTLEVNGRDIPRLAGELWTSRQRQASSIHEISYRACFKPQLPRYFIKLFTKEGELVYDPFAGRGTTSIEAGLLGRRVANNDINPLSEILARPRLNPPALHEVKSRLERVLDKRWVDTCGRAEIDLSMFYHPRTESEIVALRSYLTRRREEKLEDKVDRWIRMVATNRMTGHSTGFFSVYTLPPNQAVSPERQRRINQRLKQQPDYRNVPEIIIRKTRSLLRNVTPLQMEKLTRAGRSALFLCRDARATPEIKPESVQLTVTSPPFLNLVQYSQDNWLRCWFNSLELPALDRQITMARCVDEWSGVMADVFQELYRITSSGGWVAFEVGEVKRGTIKLDEYTVPLGIAAGFKCRGILVNLQKFTKTSNIWGIDNNRSGTNTNRIVLFQKP